MDEKQLLQGIKEKDANAISLLYDLTFETCARIVIGNGGSLEDSKDVFHDAILSLIVKFQKPDFKIESNLKGYMFSTFKFLWFKEKSKRRKISSYKTSPLKIIEEKNAIKEKEELEDEYTLLNECIKMSSSKCQQLLDLIFIKKMKNQNIVPIMGYTLNFVKKKKRRCLDALKKCMERKRINE